MYVLRHDHVPDQSKPMTPAHFLENLHEAVARSRRSQQWSSLVATERDEVQVALPITAFQRIAKYVRHASKRKSAPLNPKGAPPFPHLAKSISGMLSIVPHVKTKANPRPTPRSKPKTLGTQVLNFSSKQRTFRPNKLLSDAEILPRIAGVVREGTLAVVNILTADCGIRVVR